MADGIKLDGRPVLRRMGKGWLFFRDDGQGYLLERGWLDGAKIAFTFATIKGFIAYWTFRVVGLGRQNGLRWRLLPSVGDWAYRKDDGRLASLAHFINAEIYRRERLTPTSEQPSPIRRRSPVGATPKALVDPTSHEGTMRDV